jgi:hypothetical protein
MQKQQALNCNAEEAGAALYAEAAGAELKFRSSRRYRLM